MSAADWPWPEAVRAAAAHAAAEPGLEVCGFIVRPPGAPPHYTPRRNAHSRPTRAFRIAPADWPLDMPILAVVHSHPRQAIARASAADIAGQRAMRLPWLIVTTATPPDLLWLGQPDAA